MSAQEDEVLCRDIFPAQALLPSGRLLRGARVFITTNRVQVWTKTASGAVHVEHEEPITEFVIPSRSTLSLNATLRVPVQAGDISVSREHGCGCSSPLKALAAPASWARR